jgi:hypothetical protein
MLSLILKLAFACCCGILSLLFSAAIPGVLKKGLFLHRVTSYCDRICAAGKDVSLVPTPEMIP